jgi:hypothetical protein
MNYGMLSASPAFICGHPKSGTSLVKGLLDSHPQLIVYPEETQFFREVLPQIANLEYREATRRAEELLLHIFRWDQSREDESQIGFEDRDYSAFSFEGIVGHYRDALASLPQNCASILSAAMIAFGLESNQVTQQSRRWVEKTPYNELHTDELFQLWPEARCIHITRDPRDNFASYVRKHPDWLPEVFAYSWRKSASLGRLNQERFGRDKYLLLRFEELIGDLDASLARLRSFLEIEDHASLKIPSRAGSAWKGNSMFGDQFNGVSSKPIGRWKDKLDRSTVSKLEILLEGDMSREGYAIHTQPTMTERLWKMRFQLAWWIKDTRRSRA